MDEEALIRARGNLLQKRCPEFSFPYPAKRMVLMVATIAVKDAVSNASRTTFDTIYVL